VEQPDRLVGITDGENETVVIGRRWWIRGVGEQWRRIPDAPVPFRSRTFFEIRPTGQLLRVLSRTRAR
jgi:hypothetical protein